MLQLEIEGGGRVEFDSRPSDAIALAVRTDAPIFASTALLDANAIEFDQEVEEIEEIVEEFREFLDRGLSRRLRELVALLKGRQLPIRPCPSRLLPSR